MCIDSNKMRKLSVIELNRLNVEEFKQAEKLPLVVVLDNVRSLHNVGSIFRTSDAFIVEKIYLCGITSTPPNAEIHKTALGAEDSVCWEYVADTKEVVNRLHAEGYKVFAVEQTENSISLEKLTLSKDEKYAIILGNEVKGVQQEVVDLCDETVEIPQFGTKHSLNVSVAVALTIWNIFTQLKLQ